MYVRWKRYDLRGFYRGTTLHSAVLVRSERVDGRVRQRHVAYLGSVRSDRLKYVGRRESFWRDVTAKLDTFALSPAERDRVTQRLAAVVPPPTPEEIAADREYWAAWIAERGMGARDDT
jgi:hypothetical protein